MSMFVLLTALSVGSAPVTYDLRPRLVPGRPVAFNVAESRVEGKAMTQMATRYQIVSTGSGLPIPVELVTGPFTARGRTFGRAKSSQLLLTRSAVLSGDALKRPPFPLSVALPGHAIKIGDSWRGVVVGPTPVPAGVQGTYRAVALVKVAGDRCVKIALKIAQAGATRITGSGAFLLRVEDGFVQSGSSQFELAYMRPDQKTRVMSVASRVTAKATVSRVH